MEERSKLASTRRQQEEDRERREKELAAEREKEEKRKAQEYRKSLEFKAQPIRHYKAIQLEPSQKPSTVSKSPKLASASRVRDAREDTDAGRKQVGQRSTSAHARSTMSTRPTSSGASTTKPATSPRSGATTTRLSTASSSPRSASASRLQNKSTAATTKATAATTRTTGAGASTRGTSRTTTTASRTRPKTSPSTTAKSPGSTTSTRKSATKKSPSSVAKKPKVEPEEPKPISEPAPPLDLDAQTTPPEDVSLVDLTTEDQPQGVEPVSTSHLMDTSHEPSDEVGYDEEPLNERPVDVGDLAVPVEPSAVEAHKEDTEGPVYVDVAQPFDKPRTPEAESFHPAEQQPQEADRQVSYSPEQPLAEQEQPVPDVAVCPPSPGEPQWDRDDATGPEDSPLETGDEVQLPEASVDQEAEAEETSLPQGGDFLSEEDKGESSPQSEIPFESLSLEQTQPKEQEAQFGGEVLLELEDVPAQSADPFGEQGALEHDEPHADKEHSPFDDTPPASDFDTFEQQQASFGQDEPAAPETNPFTGEAQFEQDHALDPFGDQPAFKADPAGDGGFSTQEGFVQGDWGAHKEHSPFDDLLPETQREPSPLDESQVGQIMPSMYQDDTTEVQKEPSPIDDEPAEAEKEPSPFDDEPAEAEKEPSPFDDEPAEAQKEPSPIDDEPAEVEKEPSPFDDEPAEAEKEPSPIDDEPAEAQKEPSPIDDEPAEAEKEPSPFDDEPAEAQKEPSPFDDEPAEAEKEPSPFDDEPAEAEKEPSPIDDEPAEVEKEPSPFDDEPAEAEKEPSPIDDEPAEAQKEPSPFDEEPAEAEKEPSPFDDEPGEEVEEPSPFGEVLPVTQTEFSPFADEPHAAQESCEGLLSTNPFEAPILQPFQEADSPVTSSSNPFGDPEPAQPVIPAEVEEEAKVRRHRRSQVLNLTLVLPHQ